MNSLLSFRTIDTNVIHVSLSWLTRECLPKTIGTGVTDRNRARLRRHIGAGAFVNDQVSRMSSGLENLIWCTTDEITARVSTVVDALRAMLGPVRASIEERATSSIADRHPSFFRAVDAALAQARTSLVEIERDVKVAVDAMGLLDDGETGASETASEPELESESESGSRSAETEGEAEAEEQEERDDDDNDEEKEEGNEEEGEKTHKAGSHEHNRSSAVMTLRSRQKAV